MLEAVFCSCFFYVVPRVRLLARFLLWWLWLWCCHCPSAWRAMVCMLPLLTLPVLQWVEALGCCCVCVPPLVALPVLARKHNCYSAVCCCFACCLFVYFTVFVAVVVCCCVSCVFNSGLLADYFELIGFVVNVQYRFWGSTDFAARV